MQARILIADDDPSIRRLLQRLLEARSGWQVCGEAADGEEAVSQVARLSPDVVVLDLAMPRKNGLQAAGEISRMKPMLPMVLLTVQGLSPELIEQARKVGFRGAVSKRKGREVVTALETVLEDHDFFAVSTSDAIEVK